MIDWGVTRTSGGYLGITFKFEDYEVHPFPTKLTSPYYWVAYPKQLLLPVGVL